MKKIVIATMLTLLLVTLVATTVFAKQQVINPNADEKALWGQSVKEYGATAGTQGKQAGAYAHDDNTPGAAADVHALRGASGIYKVPPPFEP